MADRRLRRHLSQDEMNRGIGMLHSGLSQRHVANVLGVSQSVVSRMWNRFLTTGNVRHLHAGGRERSTNEVQDRFLVFQARRHRFDNATTLRRDFQNATGVRISTQTVLGYGECQMSVLLQFVWQNMIGLAGAQSWFGRE